jgi:hypothetical protein
MQHLVLKFDRSKTVIVPAAESPVVAEVTDAA